MQHVQLYFGVFRYDCNVVKNTCGRKFEVFFDIKISKPKNYIFNYFYNFILKLFSNPKTIFCYFFA